MLETIALVHFHHLFVLTLFVSQIQCNVNQIFDSVTYPQGLCHKDLKALSAIQNSAANVVLYLHQSGGGTVQDDALLQTYARMHKTTIVYTLSRLNGTTRKGVHRRGVGATKWGGETPHKRNGSIFSEALQHLDWSTNTAIVIAINKSEQLVHVQEIVERYPNLVKLIFLHNEYSHNNCSRVRHDATMSVLHVLHNFATKVWHSNRSLYIYFLLLCSSDTIVNHHHHQSEEHPAPPSCRFNEIFHFDAATVSGPHQMNGQHDEQQTASPASQLQNMESIQLDSVANQLQSPAPPSIALSSTDGHPIIKLNGRQMNVTFFATTNAFLKAETQWVAKTIPEFANTHSLSHMESYFGVDVEILKELSHQMNFTVYLMPTTDNQGYGFKEADGKFNGALGDVLYGRTEFMMNGFFVKDYETRQLEFSTASTDDKLCIVVRSADMIPDAVLIFTLFTSDAWLALALTVMITTVLYTILLQLIITVTTTTATDASAPITNNGSCSTTNIANITTTFAGSARTMKKDHIFWQKMKLQLKSIILNMTINLPRITGLLFTAPVGIFGTRSSERCFIALCMAWSVIISGLFQGKLIDVYTTPKSYQSIDTLKALDESGIPIAVRHAGLIVDVFGEEPTGTPLGNLRHKMLPSDDDKLCTRISARGDVAGLERQIDTPKFSMEHIRSDGVSLLHQIPECPRSYTVAFLFPKSSALLDTVNHYVLRFMEAGLTDKWYRDSKFILEFQNHSNNREIIQRGRITLTLSHLQVAFFVLFVGLFSSFIVLLIELMMVRRIKDLNK